MQKSHLSDLNRNFDIYPSLCYTKSRVQPSFPGKILVIDDDPDLRDLYKEVLTEGGYQIDVASDGQEGLTKILLGGYDLILLDIMMPKIDGIGILKRLKDKPPDVYNGPIFVLSVLNQDEIIKKAMDLGAKGYIIKSDLTPDQVLNKISAILLEKQK